MITYNRFDNNGKYKESIIGLADNLEHENPLRIYIGPFPGSDHYHDIANNVPVSMPASPGPNYVFDYSAKQWSDPRSLVDVRAATWAAVKASRDAAINAPLVTPRGTFDSDDRARANIGGSVALAQTLGTAFSAVYTLADNSAVTLDAAAMVSVGIAMGMKVQAAFATGRTLRAQIDAAATPAALALIAWPAT